jgi:hypothetical protein
MPSDEAFSHEPGPGQSLQIFSTQRINMKFLIAVFLALIVSIAGAAENPIVRTGTLNLVFSPEWQFTAGTQRVEGRGPQGEFMIMTYLNLPPDAPADVIERHWQVIRGFANDKMPGIAASHQNEVRRPLTETALPDGRVQFSTVSQGKKMFRDYYFLQYMLGSPRSMVFMTVEGYGNAEEAAQRFERILATQQWNE